MMEEPVLMLRSGLSEVYMMLCTYMFLKSNPTKHFSFLTETASRYCLVWSAIGQVETLAHFLMQSCVL